MTPQASSPAQITVALATKDRPEGLSRFLSALFAGSALPGEVVVVDQGSQPLPPALLSSFEKAPVPVHYVRQPALGLSASRNLAVSCARFPVIAFSDDDCVPEAGWVQVVQDTFTGQKAPDAVSGRVLPLGPETPDTYPVSQRTSRERVDYRGKQLPWQAGTGGNFAIRRSRLDTAGGFDERLGVGSPGKACEDLDLIYRLLLAGAVIRYEPEMVIYHERQSWQRRLSSRVSYAHGIGAFCALTLRRGDRFALRILFTWLYFLVRRVAAGLLHRQGKPALELFYSIKGMVPGLVYGFRLGSKKKNGEA